MPFSFSGQISAIVGFAEQLNPMSVLDVGTGMGQYGFLLRNNLENINLFEITGSTGRRKDKSGWARQIDGIEGFAEYLTPVHDYAYNRILIGNALDLLPTVPDASYDLVIAIDILEHFDRAEGERFARECLRISRRACLISTPKEFMEQEVEANPLENHRSHWSDQDLQQLGFTELLPDSQSWIAIARRN